MPMVTMRKLRKYFVRGRYDKAIRGIRHRAAERGTRNGERGTGNAECGMRNAECGMRNAECGLWNKLTRSLTFRSAFHIPHSAFAWVTQQSRTGEAALTEQGGRGQ